MSETTYTVDCAKTGRSSCKKCKVKIDKGEIRIGKNSPGPGGYDLTAWHHPTCFVLPKALKDMSGEDFVNDLLEDISAEGTILPARKDELIVMIDTAPVKAKKSEDGGDPFIAKLKREYDEIAAQADGDEAPKKKKSKTSSDDDQVQQQQQRERALELYGEYHKMTLANLKEILKMNRQVQAGTKPIVLHKLIDGALNGRLARCKVCEGGRLKMNDDCSKVVCLGTFDESSQVKIICNVDYKIEDAPRFQPWFTEDPTEEETAEMDRLEAVSKGEEEDLIGDAAAAAGDDSDLGKLMKTGEGIVLDTSGKKGAMKASAKQLVELLEANDSLDLPGDLLMKVGKDLLNNKDKTTPELLQMFAKEFGWKTAKEAKAKGKEAALKNNCACPANAAIVLVFDEMADLYFKDGNKNAGATYKKVVKALKDLDFEVTEDNAKSLGKAGKNKVAGLGKGSADKMYEYLTTETIAKLEELRENNA